MDRSFNLDFKIISIKLDHLTLILFNFPMNFNMQIWSQECIYVLILFPYINLMNSMFVPYFCSPGVMKWT